MGTSSPRGTLSCVRRSRTCELSRRCIPLGKFQGRANYFEQGFLSERLSQEGYGSSFECLIPDFLIRVSGDENDRNVVTCSRQVTLQLKSIHACHLHVKHKT